MSKTLPTDSSPLIPTTNVGHGVHGHCTSQRSTPRLGELKGFRQGCSEDKEQCQLEPRAWAPRRLDSHLWFTGTSPGAHLAMDSVSFRALLQPWPAPGGYILAGSSMADFRVQWPGWGLDCFEIQDLRAGATLY